MRRRGVKLIAPNRDGIFSYQGNCKIIIDCVTSKMLKVEPKNQEFPDISVMFVWKWKFIQKENLLFIFAENNIQDFVLIFANQEICKKVHNVIFKTKQKLAMTKEDSIETEEFQQRFLIQIFQIFSKKGCPKKFKRIIRDWNEKLEGCDKMELLKHRKKRENSNQKKLKNIKQELNNERSARKRPFNEMETTNKKVLNTSLKNVKCEQDAEGIPFKKKKAASKIIDKSKFKNVNDNLASDNDRMDVDHDYDFDDGCFDPVVQSNNPLDALPLTASNRLSFVASTIDDGTSAILESLKDKILPAEPHYIDKFVIKWDPSIGRKGFSGISHDWTKFKFLELFGMFLNIKFHTGGRTSFCPFCCHRCLEIQLIKHLNESHCRGPYNFRVDELCDICNVPYTNAEEHSSKCFGKHFLIALEELCSAIKIGPNAAIAYFNNIKETNGNKKI